MLRLIFFALLLVFIGFTHRFAFSNILYARCENFMLQIAEIFSLELEEVEILKKKRWEFQTRELFL